MKNKKTLLIAGCLALLCCGFWAKTTLISKTNAKAAKRVKIQFTTDALDGVGPKMTAAEILKTIPENLKAKVTAHFASQGWNDTTRLNMIVRQKMGDGTWQQVSYGEKDKRETKECYCLCTGGGPAGCPAECACQCMDGNSCD